MCVNTKGPGEESGVLTYEALLSAIDSISEAINPTLYYGTNEAVQRGKFMWFDKTELTPEFIVCHPDDLEVIKGMARGSRRLVHLRESDPMDWGGRPPRRLNAE